MECRVHEITYGFGGPSEVLINFLMQNTTLVSVLSNLSKFCWSCLTGLMNFVNSGDGLRAFSFEFQQPAKLSSTLFAELSTFCHLLSLQHIQGRTQSPSLLPSIYFNWTSILRCREKTGHFKRLLYQFDTRYSCVYIVFGCITDV